MLQLRPDILSHPFSARLPRMQAITPVWVPSPPSNKHLPCLSAAASHAVIQVIPDLICVQREGNRHSYHTIKPQVTWRWRWAKESITLNENNLNKSSWFWKMVIGKHINRLPCDRMMGFPPWGTVDSSWLRQGSSLVAFHNDSRESCFWEIFRDP